MATVKNTKWRHFAYGNGMYVVGGENAIDSNIAYSTDGINWTPVDTSVYRIDSMAYGNGKFIACGMGKRGDASNTDVSMGYSNDGKSWSFTTLGYYTDYRKLGIIFAENRFVAGGKNRVVEYSTDGVTWNSVTVVNYDISYPLIAYGNGIYIALESASSSQARYSISRNGLTGSWTSGNLASEQSIKNVVDVIFNGEEFVIIAGKTIYTTPDFITFTRKSSVSGRLLKASYKDGLYVIVGKQGSNDNAYLAYSTDLTEWTEINPIIDETGKTVTNELDGVLIM